MKKINSYEKLRAAHQAEFNTFPIMFAFSDDQFAEGMRRLGLEPSDTDKVYGFRDVGGFYRKSDAPTLKEMLERHDRDMAETIAGDETGEGFIRDMFAYELANHEYGYTHSLTDTLEALSLTLDAVNADPRLKHGLALAIKGVTDAF